MMLVPNLVLNNLPPAYTKERIKDFVEGTLDVDVKHVAIHHALPGKALVTFRSKIEFTTATETLKECSIEKKIVDVQETRKKQFAVIVSDVEPEYLCKEFLEIYFCSQFGDGEDIVSSCQMVQNMAFVKFKTSDIDGRSEDEEFMDSLVSESIGSLSISSDTDPGTSDFPKFPITVLAQIPAYFIHQKNLVMSHILAQQDHVPLPSENYHILVEPFYIQFHDCLEQQLLCGEEKLDVHEKFGHYPEKKKISNDELEHYLIKSTDVMQNREMDEDNRSDDGLYMDAEIDNEEQNEDESSNDKENEEDSEGNDHNLEEKICDKKWGLRKANKKGEELSDQRPKRFCGHRGISRVRKVFNRDAGQGSERPKEQTDCDQTVIQHQCITVGRGSAVRGRGKPINKAMSQKIHTTDVIQNREMDEDNRSDDGLYMDAEIDNEEQNEDESSDDKENEEDSEGNDHNLEEKICDKKWGLRKANKKGEELSDQRTKGLRGHRGISRVRKVFNRDAGQGNERPKEQTDCDQTVIQHQCITVGRGSAVRGRGKPGRGKPINKATSQKIHPTVGNTSTCQTHETSGEETENEIYPKNLNRRKSSFDVRHGPHYSDSALGFTSSSKSEKNPVGEEGSEQNVESQKNQPSKPFIEKEWVTKIKSTFLESSFGNFEECTVKYDAEQEVVLFEGTEKCVRERHLMLLAELKKIKVAYVELTPSVREILTTIWQQQCLEKLDNLIKPKRYKLLWENHTLKIFAQSEDNLKSSLEVVKDEISGSQFIDIQGSIKENDFQNIKSFTECKFPVIVSFTKGNILIQGLKEEVTKATKSIKDRLVNFLDVKETFDLIGPKAAYFDQVLKHKIHFILNDVSIVEKTISNTKVRITFCGTLPHVNEAIKKLNNIKSTIHSKSWDLFSEFNKKREDMQLVTVSLSKSTQCITNFGKEHDCLVNIILPKITEAPSPHSQKFKEKSARKKTFSQKHDGVKCHSRKAMTEVENSLVYHLNNSCQLFLQTSANITQEGSTVLVCVLDDKVDLRRTRVGMDFNKSCPSLWKLLNAAREKESLDTSVLVTNGPFQGLPRSCQAVYHAILSKWSPGSSEAKLALIVKAIVTNAINSKMTSISIPPLGCGKLLGYPSSSVAQIMIKTLHSHVGQSSIKRVVLLGKDPQLMGDYKKEAEKVLLPVTPASAGKDFSSKERAESDQNLAYSPAVDTDDESSENLNNMDDSSEEEEENMDPQYEGPGSLTIWTGGKENFEKQQSLDTIWAMLKKIIIAHCLHVEYFNQLEFEIWPRHFYNQIISAAKKECVWIETSKNSNTNKASFIAKGEKHAVDKIIKTIGIEFKHHQEKQLQWIVLNKARRGTLEFAKHAAKSTEPVPLYWNLGKKEKDNPGFIAKFLNKFVKSQSKESIMLKNVNSETKAAIVKLVTQDLFDPTLVGQGRDAVNLNHKGIKVTDVKRVENPGLFEPYNNNRKRLFQECCTRQRLCNDIGKIPGSKGRVITTEKLPSFMKTELYWEVNEHYLFHGTSATETLVTSGPDPRVGSEGGMFGKGFYLAEKTTKADQYADNKSQRTQPGTELTLIMFRALLGNPFLCDNYHPSVQSKGAQKLSRPPCTACKKDKCFCSPQVLYDSVIGDGSWIFREFILYDQHKCYPEYVITYTRV